jgi:hypothetical protein
MAKRKFTKSRLRRFVLGWVSWRIRQSAPRSQTETVRYASFHCFPNRSMDSMHNRREVPVFRKRQLVNSALCVLAMAVATVAAAQQARHVLGSVHTLDDQAVTE